MSLAFCPNPNNFLRLKAREIIRIWTKRPWNYSLISLVTIWLHILIVFYHRSDCQNALQQRLLLSSTCHVTMWTIWAQHSCFHCQDQEEIGIIVALESGAQLAIKREGESCIAFIRIKFISKRDVEHLSLRYAGLDRFLQLCTNYVAVLFVCVCLFRNLSILCIFTHLSFDFFLSRWLY